VYIIFCRWLCLSVHLYVCLFVMLLQIDFSFLFLDGIEPFFGRQFSMWHSTKHCSSIFDLGPPMPKIYSPKFGTKSPISRLVWQIVRRCLCLLGGFWGWPIQWNHAKCCGTDPCCHGNDIWARRGDLVAYRLVIMCVSVVLTVPLASPEVCPSCFQLVNRSASLKSDVILYFHVSLSGISL